MGVLLISPPRSLSLALPASMGLCCAFFRPPPSPGPALYKRVSTELEHLRGQNYVFVSVGNALTFADTLTCPPPPSALVDCVAPCWPPDVLGSMD